MEDEARTSTFRAILSGSLDGIGKTHSEPSAQFMAGGTRGAKLA